MNMLNLILKFSTFMLVLSIFAAGWLANLAYVDLHGLNIEMPFSNSYPKEIPSPYDHITKEQVHVYKDRIVIDLENAQWAEFTDTNSMDPVLDIDSNSFEIKPSSEDQIHVGDIVSYRSDYTSGLIVHRVIETNQDEEGWYAIIKGDNLNSSDPGKVRFNQIHGILVGVIY